MNRFAHTETNNFIRWLVTNDTTSGITPPSPTATEPLNANIPAVRDLWSAPRQTIQQNLMILPFAIGADDVTFNVAITGWKLVSSLWVPVMLGQLACTAGTTVGVAGGDVLNTERFADVIAVTYGSGVVTVVSPANNSVGSAFVPLKGCGKIQINFDINSSATSCNCLAAAF